MDSVVVIFPSSVSFADLIAPLRADLAPAGEGRWVLEDTRGRVYVWSDDTLRAELEDVELAELEAVIPNPQFAAVDFSNVRLCGELLARFIERDDVLVNDHHGRVLPGSAFVRELRASPERDWRAPSSLIRQDARRAPNAFIWQGAVPRVRLTTWCAQRGLTLPADLFELLRATGGGDLFESETLLAPFAGQDTGDDADGANAHHDAAGLPARYWLVVVGLELLALDRERGMYVSFSPANYEILAEYGTLEAWYLATIRAEFGSRYGLSPSA